MSNGEEPCNGYTVFHFPVVLKKKGLVKGEGKLRKYTEETFVEELRGAMAESAEASTRLIKSSSC